ncbi:hypothetical protein M3Y97_00643900 [Aphelenchoides bicaudatus]|nr:hypothetical protein M3Y97_00643900 [Aphelenchoides bicaudatus]
MRFALLVCLLASAVTASQLLPQAAFQKGRTYEYRFRTQVSHSLLTDVHSAIREQAVTGLQATLKLSFTNDQHARVQLQNVRLGEINGQMNQGQEQMIPSERFEKRDLPEEVKERLQFPYTVVLADGVVQRINFDKEDSAWSKNIKRAALNLLQLNLKRNDVQGLKLESSQPQTQDEEIEGRQPTVFVIPEITLEGQCETTYTVQQREQRSEEHQQFNVTKNINFNKCRKVSDVNYGIQVNADQQLRCLKCLRQADIKPELIGKTDKQEQLKLTVCQEECQTNQLAHQKDIERSTVARFELQGNREKYAIKRSKIISQYVVKAQNPQAQNTVSQVVAISELVFKQQESEQPVPEPKNIDKDETLQYSPEWDLNEKRFYMWGDEEVDAKRSPFAKIHQKAHKAGEIVRKILSQWNEDKETGYELNTAIIFNQLVQIVRQSTVQELKEIEQQTTQGEGREQDSDKHAKSLFLDALAVAATRNTMHVLEQKIKKQEVSTLKAAQLIKIFIANQHSPSDRQADILEKIANSEAARQCPVLKQTAWLAYGAAIGKICQQKPAESQHDQFRVEELCPENKQEQFKKTLMYQWMESNDVYNQILALKAIGNSGLEKTLPELQKIIVDKRQPVIIRIESIDALRRLRTTKQQKIQQILLPIFQDQREQPEIRMAAVTMLLYTRPSQVMLDQIVFSIQNERSMNVKSFVMSNLEALSKSPVNAEQQIAQHLKAALKFVKMSPEQMRASRKYRIPIYVSEQQNTEEQNIFLGLASIVSPSNMIPVHLAANLQTAFNGDATQEKVQLTFRQKDLETLYEKLTNAYERFGNDDEPDYQERQSAKDLRQIYSSLGIKSRRTGNYYLSSEEFDTESSESVKRSTKMGSSQPFGMICIRTNDIDQVIVPVDEHNLPQALRKAVNEKKFFLASLSQEFSQMREQLSNGKHFQQHIAMSIGETKTKLPTSAGLPLAVIWQTSAVASIQGKIQGEIKYSNQKLTGELKLRSSAIATHMHKTETWTPVVISGVQSLRTVELNHNDIRLKVQVSTQGQTPEVEMTLELPKQAQKERVLGLHTLPATYVQKFDWEKRSAQEPRIKVVRNLALEHTQFEYNMQPFMSHAIRVEGNAHRVWSPKQLLNALYTTENNVHVYYKPTENTPTELYLRIAGFSFQRDQEHKRPEFDDFYHGHSSSKRQPFRSIYEDDESDYKSMELSSFDNKQRHGRISSFSDSYDSSKSYKHELNVELKARTPRETHEANMQIKGQCDNRLQHCKAEIQMRRSPMGSESQNWKLNAKIQTIAPQQVRNEEEPETKQSKMLVKAEAQWGQESSQQQEVHLRVQAEPTRKTYWQQDESADKWSRFLNKIDLVADYKLHSQQRQFVERLFNMARLQYFWQLSVDGERKGEPNTVRASLLIDPITRRQANFTVQTPEERTQGRMLELPMRVQPFALERRSQQYHSFSQLVQSYSQSSECRADDRRVRTFDGVSYRAPLSECWSVLAKDCSREQPRFVVLMKKTDEGVKKVKIITPESTIELKRESNKMIVKIDGQQVDNEERLQEQGVETSSHQIYVQKRGITVRFDGQEVKIQITGTYKNLNCGLCGHYSDEQEDEFRMPNGQRSSQNLKDFHKSYTLKNQECDEQKYNKFYQERDSNEFQLSQKKQKSVYYRNNFYNQEDDSSEERGQMWQSSEEDKENGRKNRPIESTKTLEYAQKLCFSVKPVKRCPRGTVPDQEADPKEVKVQFFCLERHSSQARRLQRQVRQGMVVDSTGFKPSFYDTVQEPTKCQSANFY